ncbi:unnamed protein product [Prunus armeniaca]
MRSHGQGGRTHDHDGGRDLPRFMGVTPPCFSNPDHHASQTQTTMLHDSKCRFDYPLAPVRLHHTGLVNLECPSRTPINTKLMTTFKGRRSTISVIASLTPYIIRPSLSEQRTGAPLKPTTNTTTKRPCSSGREPDG